MKWFRARYRYAGDGVQPVEIARETKHRVVFDNKTWANKRSAYQSFFPTRLEAARWLEEQTRTRTKSLALTYQRANEEWRNARATRIAAELEGEE